MPAWSVPGTQSTDLPGGSRIVLGSRGCTYRGRRTARMRALLTAYGSTQRTLHSVPADNGILDCTCKSVTDVQRTSDVGRRDDNRETFGRRFLQGFRCIGTVNCLFFPPRSPRGLDTFRHIFLVDCFAHIRFFTRRRWVCPSCISLFVGKGLCCFFSFLLGSF